VYRGPWGALRLDMSLGATLARMPTPRSISAAHPPSDGGDGSRAELPDTEALDAYSRTVSSVAERLAPSVANLRVTRRGRGMVRALLVRSRAEVPEDGRDLVQLAQAGFDAGVDADPQLVVDRSLADGVVHAASSGAASLVLVVERERHVAPALGSWAEAVAGAAPAPVAMVRGTTEAITDVRILDAPPGAASPSAFALTRELAGRVGRSGVARRDDRNGRWPDDLGGGVAIAPVASWELLAEVPTPRTGALVLVPEPAAWRPEASASTG
jgi:nucleotide-binding universal stress UspA family protein